MAKQTLIVPLNEKESKGGNLRYITRGEDLVKFVQVYIDPEQAKAQGFNGAIRVTVESVA